MNVDKVCQVRVNSVGFIRTWEINTEVCQVRVNSVGFIRTWEINTEVQVSNKRKMCLPCFEYIWTCFEYIWMVWRCHGILCVHCYYFCIEPTVRMDENDWDEDDLRHCYGNWSQLCSKFLLKNYEAHWKQHYERYPTAEYFTEMDQHTC